MMNISQCAKAAGLVVGCQLALGCSSDGESSNGNGAGSLIAGGAQGIYRLDASTLNEAGCDVEGPNQLEDMQIKYVYLLNGMGSVPYVQLAFCIDVDHCRDVRRRSLEEFAYNLDGLEFIEQPTGEFMRALVFGSDLMDGQCVGGSLNRNELVMSGDSFEVEGRSSTLLTFPPDESGRCFEVTSPEVIESGTCEELYVYRGTFAEPL